MLITSARCLTSVLTLWRYRKSESWGRFSHSQTREAATPSSYRPLTILSPVVKVLESLILPTLRQVFPLADHQHGFRSSHSTAAALCEVTTAKADGLNNKRPYHRTVVVALDLTKAFDTVSRSKLLQDVYDSTLPHVYKR